LKSNNDRLMGALFTFAGRISARREASDAVDADERIAPAIAEEANKPFKG
jgi:hypothetical protein